MLDTVADAVEVADELVSQRCKQGAQVEENAASAVLRIKRSVFVLLLASLKKALEDAASEKAERDAHFALTKLAIGEHKVVWTNV